MKSRTFTVREANQTLPLVRRITEDIARDYAELSACASEYKRLRAEQERDETLEERLNELKHRMGSLSDQIDEFVHELTEIGCEMKDLEKGLVDFPSRMDGRLVFLCWCHGEEQVEHWHELTGGFAGRRPLPVSVAEE
jgi:hypothetical protein